MNTWKTKDGTVLNIRDMETSHIINCINMLRRTIASRPDEYAWGEPEGEMAQDCFNSEVRRNDHIENQMRQQINIFKKELESRAYKAKPIKDIESFTGLMVAN